MSAPYSARHIAAIFVQRGIDENRPVTQMKLQKLVYFAHGYYMANNEGEPLIIEPVEAWQFGPVISSIYSAFKFYGSEPITDFKLSTISEALGREKLDKKSTEALMNTWKTTRNIDGVQLSKWSHLPDSPWSNVYNAQDQSLVIPNEMIMNYFKKFINFQNGIQ